MEQNEQTPEAREEALYLGRVQAHIDRERARMETQQQTEKKEIREQNRAFLEENPFASVYGRAEGLKRENEHREETIEELELKRRQLAKMRLSPYFGRVDFVFDGENAAEKMYIGIATLTDFSTNEILVYDWRAPVSSLFYLGETGPAAYRAPAGEITGEITRIRQYRFQDGTLQSFWDADLQIDDSVLREALSGSADGQMRSIVCTIQREQNRAIRFDLKKNLTVFGPAGCGKTSIGMHRLSWVLYQLRASGYHPSVLMFTNNAAFRSYVSSVLPELGELNAGMCSFPELFDRYLNGFGVSTALSQTEALLRGDKKRTNWVKKLYDSAFLAFTDTKLKEIILRFKDLTLYGETVLTAEVLRDRFSALPVYVPVKQRLETVANWACEEIGNYFLTHKKEIMLHIFDEMELGDSSAEKFRILKNRILGGARQMITQAIEDDPARLAVSFSEDFYHTEERDLRERINAGSLYFEDAVLMLYIAASLGNCVLRRSPEHILIDEAQDLAPIQHKLLRALYPKAIFTVLADENQGISPLTNTDEKTLTEIYAAEALRMQKSYRATRQLCDFSKQFLPPENARFTSFHRDGPPPFRYRSDDAVQTAADILRALPENCKSACVILETADKAAAFGNALKSKVPGVSVIKNEKKELSGSVFCLPVSLAKGLEFDAVILPEADVFLQKPRIAYLAVTRALHQLHLIERAGTDT